MEFFNEYNILINQSTFDYDYDYKMIDYHYIYDYMKNIDLNENLNLSPVMSISILIMIYLIFVYVVTCFLTYENYDEDIEEELVLNDTFNGVSCLKVPKVFAIVAKEHFNTDINICLTYAGKLSLGRYLSKQVVRKDISIMYLTDKDPITKKTFRFLRYTKGDYQNMKTATQQWILSKEDKWPTYFAY